MSAFFSSVLINEQRFARRRVKSIRSLGKHFGGSVTGQLKVGMRLVDSAIDLIMQWSNYGRNGGDLLDTVLNDQGGGGLPCPVTGP